MKNSCCTKNVLVKGEGGRAYLKYATATEEEQVADDDAETFPVVQPHEEEV
jgi:hypothetical protein